MTDIPSTATKKLAALSASADDAEALAASCQKRINAARNEIFRLRDLLDKLDEKDSRHAEVSAEVIRHGNDIEVLEETMQRRKARAADDRKAAVDARNWLGMCARNGDTLKIAAPVELPQTTDLRKAVTDVRAEIEAMKSQRRRLRQRPHTADELKAGAAEWVRQLGSGFTPVIANLKNNQPFALSFELVRREGDGGRTPILPNALQLVAWMSPDLLLAAIERDIDAQVASAGDPLSAIERKAAVAKLNAEILARERVEEALLIEAQERGLDIGRRVGASPAAILGIEVVKARVKKAA